MTLKEAFPEAAAPPLATAKAKPKNTAADLAVRSLLRNVREYLSDPKHWAQGVEMEKTWSRKFLVIPHLTTSYCLVGGVYGIGDSEITGGHYSMDTRIRAGDRIERAIKVYTGKSWDIMDFNDRYDTTHQDVLNVLDLAIKG